MNKNHMLAILGLAIFIGFFYNLGEAPLFDRDEGAFSEATREMLVKGDYISTWLNDEPRYDKPILIYWFQAISVSLFGLNEFALRLPSAVFATLWVLATFFFARKETDEKSGWLSAVMLPTSLWFLVIGRSAIADALLNMLLTMSMFDGFRYFKYEQKKFLYRTFLWIGLGFLTKGPVALAIPGAVSFLFYASQKQWKNWFKMIFNPLGILIFLAVSMPWYVAQYINEGQAFIDGFFFKHNVRRFTSTMEGHGGAFIYYIPIVMMVVLPYTSLLIRSFWRIKRISSDLVDRYLWLWFFFVLIFFSVSGTKLPHYILHGSTPLIILMARHRDLLKSRFWALFPAILFLMMVTFLPEIVKQAIPFVKDDLAVAIMRSADPYLTWSFRLIPMIVLFVTLVLIFWKRWSVIQSLLFVGLINAFMVTQILIPTVGKVQQGPMKEAALRFKDNPETIVMWGLDNPSFSLYREKPTPWRAPEDGELVITKITRLKRIASYEVLYQKGAFAVARVHQFKKESND